VPLQHAHPDVLKRMKRPANGEEHRTHPGWRAMCPDITIRSTFIAGFPGETEAEFEYLLDFLKEAEIDRLGCFAYSPVEGATANELANPVPEEVREERRRVMQLQEEISKKRLQAKVGKTLRVLIDEVDRNGGTGRLFRCAGNRRRGLCEATVRAASQAGSGQFVDVRITAADAHDLWGAAE
jgi:ribosomal protein S12 methylthiotransferase